MSSTTGRRVPQADDFLSKIVLKIVPPPGGSVPHNVLLLFHGLGDTCESFANLGKNMNLPETVCISVQAPTPLPFDIGGFHWGDDIQFGQESGNMDFDTGFIKVKKMIEEDIIEAGLVKKCGFQRRDVILFGYGQGGMAALAVAAGTSGRELGGVISIGGPMPSDSRITDVTADQAKASSKSKTPVLVLGGDRASLITQDAVSRLKESFAFMDHHVWRGKARDGMPSNRQEMLPIMQFFGRRLRSRAGAPSDAVEVI